MLYKELMSAEFYCYRIVDETNEAGVCAPAPVSASLSALAHCETVAVEMASTSVITIMKISCAKLPANSFICGFPPTKIVRSLAAVPLLCNVYASVTANRGWT